MNLCEYINNARSFHVNEEQGDERSEMVFCIRLLMEKPCEMPNKRTANKIMRKHLGISECLEYSNHGMLYAVEEYIVHYNDTDQDLPVMLSISSCDEIKKPLFNDIEYSQTWNCPKADELIHKCKYQVIAKDLLATGLDYKERAEMIVHYAEALVEMYPQCLAVVFDHSKKIFSRDDILNCMIPIENRFIYYAVNVRFFYLENKKDMLVDTIGMSMLFLPDLQYRFCGFNPKTVVNHAYNMLYFIYENNNPVRENDYIDGIRDDCIDMRVQWPVKYENSMIQPIREVINVNMGEYSG